MVTVPILLAHDKLKESNAWNWKLPTPLNPVFGLNVAIPVIGFKNTVPPTGTPTIAKA